MPWRSRRATRWALPGVLRPDGSGESVLGVVGDAYGVVLVGEALHGEHGTEGLLVHHAHVLPALVEHGRRVVVAAGERGVVGAFAAAAQYGALGEAGRDVRLDLLQVLRGDQRSGLGLGVEGAAEPDLPGAADHLVDEAVVQRVLDDQPGAGRADLPRMQEDGREGEVHGRLEVGVGEDHVGVLAAELQRHLLHGRGGRGHDPLAGLQAAGEGDHVDGRVLGERCAHLGPGAQDEVGGAGREPGLLQRPHQQDRGGGGELTGLEDDRVAGERGPGRPSNWPAAAGSSRE